MSFVPNDRQVLVDFSVIRDVYQAMASGRPSRKMVANFYHTLRRNNPKDPELLVGLDKPLKNKTGVVEQERIKATQCRKFVRENLGKEFFGCTNNTAIGTLGFKAVVIGHSHISKTFVALRIKDNKNILHQDFSILCPVDEVDQDEIKDFKLITKDVSVTWNGYFIPRYQHQNELIEMLRKAEAHSKLHIQTNVGMPPLRLNN